jgi:hypothetical protein
MALMACKKAHLVRAGFVHRAKAIFTNIKVLLWLQLIRTMLSSALMLHKLTATADRAIFGRIDIYGQLICCAA